MTQQEQWKALEQRDPSYDGLFVFAVTSTGIFCRPSCPARRPLAAHIRFFASPVEAEAAGFRACRRCRPQSVPTRFEERRAAMRSGGITPREWKAADRLNRLKTGLRQGSTVTTALYDAGFGSSSRLYETAVERMGMTPGVYRRGACGLTIRYEIRFCPLGRILAAATERGICAVLLASTEHELVESLRREFPKATLLQGDDALGRHLADIVASLGSSSSAQALPLDLHGTAFQIRVWRELRNIPPGETRTYQQVAAAVNRPTAARAVAAAIAANKTALLVPCHRVIRTGGALSGYRWGSERKKALLKTEQRLE